METTIIGLYRDYNRVETTIIGLYRDYLRADAVPPTPKEGAATSDGTGGASGKESFCRSQTIFLRLA